MARRGNGIGRGIGQGPGWGGPARGAGSGKVKAAPFVPGNCAAVGKHDFSRSAQRQVLLDKLFVLACTADEDATRVSVAVAWLNRYEGKPRAQSVQLYVDDLAGLDDDALDRETERLRTSINNYK